MEIQDLVIYRGRNIYSHTSVMKMIVDIGKYGNIPTKSIEGFNEKLLKALPELKKNYCGLGYEGGFLEKLNDGTYLAHVLEHVILEMQSIIGYDIKYGKTRVIKEPSLYYLVYEYENEVCGLECGKAAVFILNRFIKGENVEISDFIDYLKNVSLNAELGPSTSSIVNEAKKRNIPVSRIGDDSLIQLGYGKFSRILEATLTDATSCIAADISSNKQLTKLILKDNNIPVPYGKLVYSEISAIMAANAIGMPVVIKPYDGNQGKGVHLNLKNEKEIKAAYKEASSYSKGIMVEQYIKGRDYRILVVGDSVKAVSERLSALVIGDGKHTIKELIEIVNLDENRGDHHEKPLTKIKLDKVTLNVLQKKGINAKYVPPLGEEVVLRENANLSTGGIAIDCTDIIHPDNADIAVRAANAIGIDIAGIDVVAEDISKSIYDSRGAVVEVNSAPGIRMHLFPSVGTQRNVAKDIVDMLYPIDVDISFPIVSITGTNGKTTTTRIVSHILSLSGKTVGMTSTSGIYINNKCVCKGDNSGPISAKVVLSNKSVDAAVFETARGGIIRAGLGYDLADVGVITNVTDDHLDIDGIETLEDLAYVKSLVVEAIKKDGYVVLNAEDEMTDYILETVRVKVILFSKYNNIAEKYNNSDYVHVYVDEGFISIKKGDMIIRVVKVEDIPITYKGLVACNIENCLAAVASLYALGIPSEIISSGLKSFDSNMGRFNIFDMNNYKVMLDYAHNKASYEAVINTCKGLNHKRLVGVVGMPGDRPNQAIQTVGNICASAFDKIFIKEDLDLRTRDQGEVSNILYKSITEDGNTNVSLINNELSALKAAISEVEDDDLIVVLYEKLDPLVDYLHSLQ